MGSRYLRPWGQLLATGLLLGSVEVAQSASNQLVTQGGDETLATDSSAQHFAVSKLQLQLTQAGLGSNKPPTRDAVLQVVERAEQQLLAGRTAQAVAALASLVESSHFSGFQGREAGRSAIFLLGKALGQMGAEQAAREVLLRLLEAPKRDSWFLRTVGLWVELAQQSAAPEQWLSAVQLAEPIGSRAVAGDLAYLRGIIQERAGDMEAALAQFSQVGEASRFWAAARYRSGLLHAGAGRLPNAESLFCQVAAPNKTPKLAPITGGRNFFEVRDLSRLALGRIAHEQLRFDDARYYYHQVPGDSRYLAEALYESATSRYEAKQYEAAFALLQELRQLQQAHSYEDEAWILEAYVNLARCEFAPANALLQEFTKRYAPVLKEMKRLSQDPPALRAVMKVFETGDTDRLNLLGISSVVASRIGSMIRVDPAYQEVVQQLASTTNQIEQLAAASKQLSRLKNRVRAGDASAERPAAPVTRQRADALKVVAEQLRAVRRMIRELELSAETHGTELASAKRQMKQLQAALQVEFDHVRRLKLDEPSQEPLSKMFSMNVREVFSLREVALGLRNDLVAKQETLGQQALARVTWRLTRLMRRAQAGRIETVLGAKSAVELEIEALSEGLLPRGAIDSLDVAQYLQDDEEYWPLDGEDWADEYIGGEGL